MLFRSDRKIQKLEHDNANDKDLESLSQELAFMTHAYHTGRQALYNTWFRLDATRAAEQHSARVAEIEASSPAIENKQSSKTPRFLNWTKSSKSSPKEVNRLMKYLARCLKK